MFARQQLEQLITFLVNETLGDDYMNIVITNFTQKMATTDLNATVVCTTFGG